MWVYRLPNRPSAARCDGPGAAPGFSKIVVLACPWAESPTSLAVILPKGLGYDTITRSD